MERSERYEAPSAGLEGCSQSTAEIVLAAVRYS